ncbi:MAG: CDP-alcohol phosphatidyltransferase family protein [bacterium]
MKNKLLNIITISRILILPVMYFSLQHFSIKAKICSLFLLLYMHLSDIIDGYLARKWKQTSFFGATLDAFIDKIISLGLIILFVIFKNFPIIVGIFLISKEVLMVIGGSILWIKQGQITISTIYGKFFGFTFFLVLIAYIFEINFIKIPLFLFLLAFGFFAFLNSLKAYLQKIKK